MLCFVDEEGKWEKRFTFTLMSGLLSWANWAKKRQQQEILKS
jgi:hypothetical protein